MNEPDSNHLRLFIGISLKEKARKYVELISKEIYENLPDLRMVPPQNLHVTLKFIGLCKAERVPYIIEVMNNSLGYMPLELEIGGVGSFPSAGSARVIWVGAKDTEESIVDLYEYLDKGLESCGIKREKRKYHPHITIGRAKRPVRLSQDILRVGTDKIMQKVNDLVLFQSILKKSGAEYSMVRRVCLK